MASITTFAKLGSVLMSYFILCCSETAPRYAVETGLELAVEPRTNLNLSSPLPLPSERMPLCFGNLCYL